MLDRDSILSFLDTSFEDMELPLFDNMNMEYVSSRLSVYRSDDEWLLVFNSMVWWPSLVGLVAIVEIVGTGVVGLQGFASDRLFEPCCIEEDGENILSIRIRGESINPSGLAVQPNYAIHSEYGFWVCTALAEKFKDRLLASPDEVKQFVPFGFRHLLTIDEWEHPVVWNRLPSQTETFPRIADVLVASNQSIWRPVKSPNTHWSHWLPK